jgi:hypothetical protein
MSNTTLLTVAALGVIIVGALAACVNIMLGRYKSYDGSGD